MLKRKKSRRARKIRAIKQLEQYRNADGTRKESAIEQKVRHFLERNSIPFIQEYPIKGKDGKVKIFDFFVCFGEEFQFLVEVDGDHWHSYEYHEGDKPYSKLTYTQKKNVYNDRKKNSLAKKLGIPLLRFWEKDVKNAFNKVVEGIYNEIYKQTKTKWMTDKRHEKVILEQLYPRSNQSPHVLVGVPDKELT